MATYTELQQQIEELKQQAAALLNGAKADAIAEIREKMAEFGITADDLSTVSKKAKTAVKAKYLDPASGKTWSGRGVSPKWLQEAVAAGRTREEFLI
jgi:DNA-binding protein H-NS